MFERLHIGTSGWSYKHWSGPFYPEGVKPAKYLEYYVTEFDCVELNASFYRIFMQKRNDTGVVPFLHKNEPIYHAPEETG